MKRTEYLMSISANRSQAWFCSLNILPWFQFCSSVSARCQNRYQNRYQLILVWTIETTKIFIYAYSMGAWNIIESFFLFSIQCDLCVHNVKVDILNYGRLHAKKLAINWWTSTIFSLEKKIELWILGIRCHFKSYEKYISKLSLSVDWKTIFFSLSLFKNKIQYLWSGHFL